ncbi:MAG: TlpA family protein disulfide reductase [Gammaproteobacteria bacterium]|nr:TlpA family protein disulfide reductase [Gammaproteobacteria bacterium]
MRLLLFCFLLAGSFLFDSQVQASQKVSLELPSGHEVVVDVYGGSSVTRVLWIGSGFGLHARHKQVASDLARLGLQVWQADLAEALFLTKGAQSMRSISGGIVAELIDAVSEKGKYRLLIISGAYGSIPALRGVHAWQLSQPKQRTVIGMVLFSPYLFTHVPNVGEAPSFVEIAKSTSVPIYIFQAEKNTSRWHLPDMVKQLKLHAPVYTEFMKDVTSLFYREDKAPATFKKLKTVAKRIKNILPLLQNHPYPLTAVKLKETGIKQNRLGLDDKLKPYRGTIQPQAFSLKDINGKVYKETDFKGKISVINFWATWCPPCVEEIPSLNRLRKKMQGKPFQLISINYGESASQIKQFMKKVAVDFPVLLDPQGRTAGEWKVVAFPSTFVIGPDGNIRYGVNAAIHWDTDEVTQKLNSLISHVAQ